LAFAIPIPLIETGYPQRVSWQRDEPGRKTDEKTGEEIPMVNGSRAVAALGTEKTADRPFHITSGDLPKLHKESGHSLLRRADPGQPLQKEVRSSKSSQIIFVERPGMKGGIEDAAALAALYQGFHGKEH
jgi:hypothetical protein